MVARIKEDDRGKWLVCGECGHKLGRIVGAWSEQTTFPAIEIKCHSCKSMNYIMVGAKKNSEGSV